MGNLKDLKEVRKVRFYSAMEGAQNKCLTVKGNAEKQADIILKAENECEGQIFSLRNYDNEYCVIVTKEEKELVLDVCGGRNEKGSRIIQYPYHGGDNQLFRLVEEDDNQYVLQSKLGHVVDISGKNTDDGASVMLWSKNGGDNQKFIVKSAGNLLDGMKDAMNPFEQVFNNIM